MKKITLLILLGLFVNAAQAQSCLPEGITFTTQEQIDNFQTNYPGCTQIEGDVFIQENDIINLNGLAVLTSIEGYLWISFANSLTSLSGLENITSIGGKLEISGTAITNLSGLEDMTSIGGELAITSNSSLTSLIALDGLLTSMGEFYHLRIGYNNALTSLIGLEGITNILGQLVISNNNSLSDLSGLDNLSSVGYLNINTSDALSSLTGLNNLTSVGSDLIIQHNVNLISLTALSNLTSLDGDLNIFNNNELTSLIGLEGITNIQEQLVIGYNNSLSSLSGLDNVSSVGYLNIKNNDALTGFTGLNNLTSVGGDIIIQHNDTLISLTALNNLTSLDGDLNIYNNNALTSLSGLENIDFSSISNLTISSNILLSTCEAQWLCDYLMSPSGIIEITKNASGCNSVVELASYCGNSIPCLPFGNYYFSAQSDIDNFQLAFPDCSELQGNMVISGNEISNLNGLNVLTSIGRDLMIIGDLFNFIDPTLTSPIGLENVTSIGGDLLIHYSSLTNLTGLENIEANSVQNLFIYDNWFLSECDILTICEYLAAPNGMVEIHDNSPGCNSPEEVEEACDIVATNDKLIDEKLFIHPNPFTTYTTIEYTLEQPDKVIITIFDHHGKQVDVIEESQSQGLNQVVWSPKNLVNGLYYFRLQAGEQLGSGKTVFVR